MRPDRTRAPERREAPAPLYPEKSNPMAAPAQPGLYNSVSKRQEGGRAGNSWMYTILQLLDVFASGARKG
jgi:hypothetical protein